MAKLHPLWHRLIELFTQAAFNTEIPAGMQSVIKSTSTYSASLHTYAEKQNVRVMCQLTFQVPEIAQLVSVSTTQSASIFWRSDEVDRRHERETNTPRIILWYASEAPERHKDTQPSHFQA